jgi:hypothetical protein
MEARSRDASPPLPTIDVGVAPRLERRGRAWLLWSFLLCPCHLPLTLAVLTTVLAGTSMGALLRDHTVVAGAVITAAWVLGTGYGFVLIRRSQREGASCPPPGRGARRVDAGRGEAPTRPG